MEFQSFWAIKSFAVLRVNSHSPSSASPPPPDLKEQRWGGHIMSSCCTLLSPARCALLFCSVLAWQSSAMDSDCCDLNSLVAVMVQADDQLAQLDARLLDEHSPGGQKKQLLLQAQSSVKKAISLAEAMIPQRQRASAGCTTTPAGSVSPGREQQRREMCKKRKTLQRWTTQVRASKGSEGDGVDDGHSWRKYGQKSILGAKHPRAYFRCTHRSTVGCLAMKQEQRSDADPSVYNITYRGEHTCLRRQQKSAAGESAQDPKLKEEQQLLLSSFQATLKVDTRGLGRGDVEQSSSPFSFASTSVSNAFSPQFVSQATAESNCFSLSPCQAGNYAGGELADLVSAATAASGPAAVDSLASVLDTAGLDPAFHFDASSFFQNLRNIG